MASRTILMTKVLPNLNVLRSFAEVSGGSIPTTTQKPKPTIPEVPGLSKNCVLPKAHPVGPGASTDGEYKVPEYFCYNKTSYYEAEVEMEKFRCPQPSALK